MLHAFSRSEELLGKDGLRTLANARVAVFGIGGVGSYVTEALARAGVGTLIFMTVTKGCLLYTSPSPRD